MVRSCLNWLANRRRISVRARPGQIMLVLGNARRATPAKKGVLCSKRSRAGARSSSEYGAIFEKSRLKLALAVFYTAQEFTVPESPSLCLYPLLGHLFCRGRSVRSCSI